MSDDGVGVVLVFVEEIVHAGECYLVDVLVYLLLGHAYTSVADGECAFVGIETHVHGEVAQFALEVATLCKGLELLCGIHGVRHHFTEENLMVGIEKLFYYGEDVLGCNPYISFLHIFVVLCSALSFANSVPKWGCRTDGKGKRRGLRRFSTQDLWHKKEALFTLQTRLLLVPNKASL